MKYLIIDQVSSVYWLERGELMFTPIQSDNTFNMEEMDSVNEELVGLELLPEPYFSAKTFTELYAYVRDILLNGSDKN
jgi:hypothetical protein